MKQSKGESGMEKTKEEKKGLFFRFINGVEVIGNKSAASILSVYDPDRGGNCSFCDICRCFCDL